LIAPNLTRRRADPGWKNPPGVLDFSEHEFNVQRMTGIATLKPETDSIKKLRNHWIFLLVRLQSEPLAASFVPPVLALGDKIDEVTRTGTKLTDACLRARAAAITADNLINRLSDRVSAAIHEGKRADLSLPLHQLYFGSLAPAEAKRGILGPQILLMMPWPALLAKATQPALLALAAEVKSGLDLALAAEGALQMAEAEYSKFLLDGEVKQLFKAYNALAASTFGGLRAIAHEQAELKLDAGWAESFYLHETRNPGVTTVIQARNAVKKLTEELAGAQAQLAELEAEEAAAEEAALQAANAEANLKAAQRETAAARQKESEAIEAAKKASKARKVKKARA
jgi:hypothetical protein